MQPGSSKVGCVKVSPGARYRPEFVGGFPVSATTDELPALYMPYWYRNDIDTIRNALRARGLRDSEMTTLLGPLDRQRLLKILADTRRRMAGWKDGNVFIYYDGHGMYRRAGQGAPQAGLQLGKDRTRAGAAMLWREFFAELAPPTGVQTVLLPDCCHTNLLAGRLPPATTAAIVKSAPQDSLLCKTGSWRFEDPRPQRRYGVIRPDLLS